MPQAKQVDPRREVIAKALLQHAVKTAQSAVDALSVDHDEAIEVFWGLGKESDAGLVVLSTSYVDNCFSDAFKRNLPNLTNDSEGILFENAGPLATFSGRIRLAHALGWVDRSTSNDLHCLRRIRNSFAHDPYKTTLSNPETEKHIKAMNPREAPIVKLYQDEGKPVKPLPLRALFRLRTVQTWNAAICEMIVNPIAKEHHVSPSAVSGKFEEGPKTLRQLHTVTAEVVKRILDDTLGLEPHHRPARE